MATLLIELNCGFFLIMGVVALARPAVVTGFFGILEIPPDMRNEVRAVYGGFGVAPAIVLHACITSEAIRSGVLLTVAVATIRYRVRPSHIGGNRLFNKSLPTYLFRR